MSKKKNKQHNTQKQIFSDVINTPIYFEDAKICKQLLVAYLHEKTEGLSTEEKIKYSKENIFPLNKKIDLFYTIDKLNNIDINATYYRLRNSIIDVNKLNVDDYFKLVSLVEILLINNQYHLSLNDDVLIDLAGLFVYETNISINLIKEYLGESKKVLKPTM